MKHRFFIVLVLVSIMLAACGGGAGQAVNPTPTAFVVEDGLGRQFSLNGTAKRVVSMAPSNTEILYAIGAGDLVVGRDEFSNYPEEAKALPSVGGSNGVYSLEQIAALKPDLVLATGINTPEQVKAISDLGIAVFYVANPLNFNQMYENLRVVGRLTGREGQAELLAKTLEGRVRAVSERLGNLPDEQRPVVFYEIDGTDPAKPYTTGKDTFVDQIIQMAGGRNVGAQMDLPWGQLSLEQLLVDDPDVIVLGDANYGTSPEQVYARAGWENLSAVKEKKVYPFNDDLMSRPGPRMVDGVEEMAKLLHP